MEELKNEVLETEAKGEDQNPVSIENDFKTPYVEPAEEKSRSGFGVLIGVLIGGGIVASTIHLHNRHKKKKAEKDLESEVSENADDIVVEYKEVEEEQSAKVEPQQDSKKKEKK